MRLFNLFVTMFYTIIFWAFAVFLIAFAMQWIDSGQLSSMLAEVEISRQYRIITGSIGIFIIIMGFLVLSLLLHRFQKEKTIAFNNPDGQVIISLKAVEGFIKDISSQIPEIKEIRSDVIARRKKIEISSNITLWSDVNIPDVTEKIQGLIKGKVQEMLGIEEPVFVSIHIMKIVKRESQKLKQQTEPLADFRGIEYR
ncbi:hypothetical protein B9J78_04125 [bacterium Unc6]|nr:hypothetical protein [bacterium Unc6]